MSIALIIFCFVWVTHLLQGFAEDPFVDVFTLNLDKCHVRIVSTAMVLAKLPAVSLSTNPPCPNAVFSINTNPGIRNSSNTIHGLDRSAYGLFTHLSLSLVYFFLAHIDDISPRELASLLFNETDQTVLVIETIFVYIFHKKFDALRTHENYTFTTESLKANKPCTTGSYFQLNKGVTQLINGNFDCLQVNMAGLFEQPSQPVLVFTDITKIKFTAESNYICKPIQTRSLDWSAAKSFLNFCILSSIGSSYNLTYIPTRIRPQIANDKSALFVWTLVAMRKQARPTVLTTNVQLVESPLFYEPLAFMSIKDCLDGLENALVGAIDFKMWAFLAIVFLCMRFSVVASLSAMDNHRQIYKGLDWKQFIVSFISSGIYKKVKLHAAIWKASKFLLVNKLLWALGMSNLVSYTYKAGLTAFLTNSPVPAYPKDLAALVSDCNKHTSCVGHFGDTFGADRRFSDINTLKGVLKRYKVKNRTQSSVVKFLKDEIKSIHIVTGGRAKSTVPSGLLDTIKTVEFVRNSMKFLVRSKKVSQSIVLSFKTFAPFYVNRSYFYRVIKKGLQSIYESGLYDQWKLYIETKRSIYLFESITRELVLAIPEVSFPTHKANWLMYLLGGRFESHHSASKSLSFSDLSAVWFVFAILLGTICVIFIFELH